MREQPWNERRASTKHYEWYCDLLDLHALTLEWLKELNVDRPEYFLKRGPSALMADTLQMLAYLTDTAPGIHRKLDEILDDTSPDDLLLRLERLINTVQAWCLSAIVDGSDKAGLPALLSQLEQASWKAGRACADRKWSAMKQEDREDLRPILAAFARNPIYGRPDEGWMLKKRVLPTETQIELLSCPHHHKYPEVLMVADQLCSLYSHWTKGFAYSLNTKIIVEYLPGGKASRCSQRWTLRQ
jgi:hypothetical protein